MIEKGTWVEIEKVVLLPHERANTIPEETRKHALKMWVKGYCLEECEMGGLVEVKTLTGRIEKGIVTEVEGAYKHDFGEYVKETSYIGKQAKGILRETIK